jgi:hypothetical protein
LLCHHYGVTLTTYPLLMKRGIYSQFTTVSLHDAYLLQERHRMLFYFAVLRLLPDLPIVKTGLLWYAYLPFGEESPHSGS